MLKNRLAYSLILSQFYCKIQNSHIIEIASRRAVTKCNVLHEKRIRVGQPFAMQTAAYVILKYFQQTSINEIKQSLPILKYLLKKIYILSLNF